MQLLAALAVAALSASLVSATPVHHNHVNITNEWQRGDPLTTITNALLDIATAMPSSTPTASSSSSKPASNVATATGTSSAPTATATLNAFTIKAVHAGAIFSGENVVANTGQFWIGQNTRTACPGSPKCAAYTSNTTAFIKDGNQLDSFLGNQSVFVSATGQLQYLPPILAVKQASYVFGQAHRTAGPGIRHFAWGDFSLSNLYACPWSNPVNLGGKIFQVFVKVSGGRDLSKCTPFDAQTVDYTGPQAYAYQ